MKSNSVGKAVFLLVFLISYWIPTKLLAQVAEEQPVFDTLLVSSDSIRSHKGFQFGFVLGFANSKHASSFEEYLVNKTKQYSGIRLFVISTTMGFGITENLSLYGKLALSPKTHISPYRSVYKGVNLSFSIPKMDGFIVYAGLGGITSKTDIKDNAGKGTLFNFGFSLEFAENLIGELDFKTGGMKEGNLDPNPFTNRESSVQFSLGFLFR